MTHCTDFCSANHKLKKVLIIRMIIGSFKCKPKCQYNTVQKNMHSSKLTSLPLMTVIIFQCLGTAAKAKSPRIYRRVMKNTYTLQTHVVWLMMSGLRWCNSSSMMYVTYRKHYQFCHHWDFALFTWSIWVKSASSCLFYAQVCFKSASFTSSEAF